MGLKGLPYLQLRNVLETFLFTFVFCNMKGASIKDREDSAQNPLKRLRLEHFNLNAAMVYQKSLSLLLLSSTTALGSSRIQPAHRAALPTLHEH